MTDKVKKVRKPKAQILAERRKRKARKKYRYQNLMKAGQMNGFLLLLRKVRAPVKCSPAIRKRWRCRCTAKLALEDNKVCGNELVIPEMYLRRPNNPKIDCGCQTGSMRTKYNNEYRIWLMVRERTRNPTHVAYEHYVSRDIDICDIWYDLATGFELFFAEVGPRISKKHSLDRIDNMRGYESENLRWATAVQQRANQGDMVAGYEEKDIIKAGYSRTEFTLLIFKGADEHDLIKGIINDI